MGLNFSNRGKDNKYHSDNGLPALRCGTFSIVKNGEESGNTL